GSDLTVTQVFRLDGGEINSGASAAAVYLDGAVGTAGGGLLTSSPVVAQDGAQATFRGGTEFAASAGLLIRWGAGVTADTGSGGTLFVGADPAVNRVRVVTAVPMAPGELASAGGGVVEVDGMAVA